MDDEELMGTARNVAVAWRWGGVVTLLAGACLGGCAGGDAGTTPEADSAVALDSGGAGDSDDLDAAVASDTGVVGPTDADDDAAGLADTTVVGDTASPDATDDAAAHDADAGEEPLLKGAPAEAQATWLDDPPACTGGDWLAKYFRYRERLRGDGTPEFPGFVSVGEAPGQSLVATQRDPTLRCGHAYFTDNCVLEERTDANGSYAWGDATVWQGFYLAVLATEYRVLKLLGMNTAPTLSDLYYALRTINRLDIEADAYYGVTDPTQALDGFYQRCDVGGDFIWADASHSAFRFPRADGGLSGYGCIESSMVCNPEEVGDIQTGFFVSQDQTIGLLMGLAAVVKLLPDEVGIAELSSLRHEARAITHRIVSNLRDHAWTVRGPDGVKAPETWGGNAEAFSNTIARCANFICGPSCEADFGIDDYRNALSRSVGESGVLGVDATWFTQTGSNINMTLKLVSCAGGWGQDKLATRSLNYGAPIYPLLDAMLHDRPVAAEVLSWPIDSMLTNAPCGGPCHNTPGCEEVPGWKGTNRWKDPEVAHGGRRPGEFNGMDYMLLFNLYFLAREGELGFVAPPPPTGSCDGFLGLEQMLGGAAIAGMSYDPTDPCATADLQQRYCGRTWLDWLGAAYRGEATVHVGQTRWACLGNAPCHLGFGDGGGTSGPDLLLGTPGADDLDGRGGDDCLYGFAGDDRIQGGQGRDEIHGGLGSDEIYGEGAAMAVDGEPDLLFGDAGDDVIHGNPGDDAIYGGDGADELYGDPGEDHIEGGEGDDRIFGDAGDDFLLGGPGDDRIDGEAGSDVLLGGPGDDFLRGGSGADTLEGNEGSDRMCGCGGDDTLWGNWDGDECRGGTCTFLNTGDGKDSVQGCTLELVSYTDCNDDI